MKPVFAVLGLLSLAACTDPREACVRQASKDLSIVRALIADTEATLARGYAIETETRTVLYTDFCFGTGRNHGRFRFCTHASPVTNRVPVAVDLEAERGKLRSLRSKEAELRRSTADEIQKCELAHAASL